MVATRSAMAATVVGALLLAPVVPLGVAGVVASEPPPPNEYRFTVEPINGETADRTYDFEDLTPAGQRVVERAVTSDGVTVLETRAPPPTDFEYATDTMPDNSAYRIRYRGESYLLTVEESYHGNGVLRQVLQDLPLGRIALTVLLPGALLTAAGVRTGRRDRGSRLLGACTVAGALVLGTGLAGVLGIGSGTLAVCADLASAFVTLGSLALLVGE